MTLSNALYTLLIGPLEYGFEIIFLIAYRLVGISGIAIFILSLVMNLLLLPLYRRTDAIQEEAIETEKKLKPFVTHIKKTFRGDERFMILQTLYRQNNYKPTDVLKGICPLMLEIPFFMAAYHFLSHLQLLGSSSFGPIASLGAPDGLLRLGGLTVNLLPILMTVINLASSAIYTREAPARTKIQLYLMAGLFLVLLYDSPAGLTFYWTLNNLFSLVKNMVTRTKKPRLVVASLFCIGSIAAFVFPFLPMADPEIVSKKALWVVGFAMNLPMIVYILRRRHPAAARTAAAATKKDRQVFFGGCLLLTLLIGLYIPASLLHASPDEFIVDGSAVSPLFFVLSAALSAAGLFLVWMGIFYLLSGPGGKRAMSLTVWILFFAACVNYIGFGGHYGNLSSNLTFDAALQISTGEILLNILVLAAVSVLVWLLWSKKFNWLRGLSLSLSVALVISPVLNLISSQAVIGPKLDTTPPAATEKEDIFRLSRTGKNVVVLMMDRAVSGFLPYIFNELPEVEAQFAGFTYYPNTISFGAHTNFGLPAVFGGYEYTPAEINKRSAEPLVSKHNEALKMMPVLFRDHGYRVTFNDPTYAGYKWIPDLSVFSDCPGIEVKITNGRYSDFKLHNAARTAENMKRNFFFYSLFRTSPVALHSFLYDEGRYLYTNQMNKQVLQGPLAATGSDASFSNAYDVLTHLTDCTKIVDDPQNTFQMMCNDTTHEPDLLQLPHYERSEQVDNSKFDQPHPTRTDALGNTVTMTNLTQIIHYHANAASWIQIGRWLDFLREEGVYDNTRIIIVSDHGYNVHLKEELEFGSGWDEDIMFYNPMLLVKDFDATEFTTDETFMTNADVPTLTVSGLIEDPVNPFTGKPINNLAKNRSPQFVCASHEYSTYKNNGTTYLPAEWLAIQGDIMDPANWVYVDEDAVS